jgi:2-dehydro-3-deoxyphosphogluconate aldolase/(4S)-4-hydroxy-2-oxoglutarate aldolase
VEICKIFPGNSVGGPDFVKDVRGPMPWTRIMPTGGVDATEESVTRWLKAGAACVGMGSKLFPADVIASKDYYKITEKVAQVLGWVKAARGDRAPIN